MISFIVCTRNRVELLKECLNSILTQKNSAVDFEIIVVDNNSTDATAAYVQKLRVQSDRVKYVFESQPGLSQARNTGVLEAKFPYVAFIDDDGKIRPDFLLIFAEVIRKYDFDCFGGWFVPWYRTPKPKWLPADIGTYPKWREDVGITQQGQDLPGGIMIIKKNALELCGGFPTDAGMRGDVVGYGEENIVQQKLRAMGKAVGFVPDMILEHLVAEYKYKLSWHFKRQFGMTRDKQVLKGYLSPMEISKGILKIITYPVPLLIFNARKFFMQKEYYWQNWILDSLSFPVRTLGSVYSSIKKR
jgi:glycosyltransferase involved in cell wall biosynthesis